MTNKTEMKNCNSATYNQIDKSSLSMSASSTGHQIWPRSCLKGWWGGLPWKYDRNLYYSSFSFFWINFSLYADVLFSKELRVRRWRMDAGHGEWWYMARSTNPHAENYSEIMVTSTLVEIKLACCQITEVNTLKPLGYILVERQERQWTVPELMDLEPHP